MGAYYLFAKAGLPLQDPPLALKIQYEIDFGVWRENVYVGSNLPVYWLRRLYRCVDLLQDRESSRADNHQAGRPSRPGGAN